MRGSDRCCLGPTLMRRRRGAGRRGCAGWWGGEGCQKNWRVSERRDSSGGSGDECGVPAPSLSPMQRPITAVAGSKWGRGGRGVRQVERPRNTNLHTHTNTHSPHLQSAWRNKKCYCVASSSFRPSLFVCVYWSVCARFIISCASQQNGINVAAPPSSLERSELCISPCSLH